MAFSKNTHLEVIDSIKFEMSLPLMNHGSRYLGVPLTCSRSKLQACEDAKASILERLAGWTSKALSQAGCMTLIKVTTVAMP